jgi:hypothetical protein
MTVDDAASAPSAPSANASPRHRRGSRRRLVVGIAGAVALGVLATAAIGGGLQLVGGSPKADAGRPASSEAPGEIPLGAGSVPASPSGSASASASASASSSRPATPPRSGGKPGAANTGVPAGTALTKVQGTQVYSTPNQVISGLDIHGFVEIRAKNVTIKNSIIRGGAPKCNSAVVWVRADAGASATIQDTEIVAAQPHPCLDGIWAIRTTLLRVNIHGVVDGVKAHDDVTIQDSYVHDLSWFANDPNQDGDATHNDAVQTYEGNRRVTLRHNTLNPGGKGNAAYQVTQDGGRVSTDLRVENNWLDGGGCTLNFSHKGGPTPMTGIYVTGNRFGRRSEFNCPIIISTQTVLSANAGNVWDDTGQPIPRPNQHD